MTFDIINVASVDDQVIKDFDCGNSDFNRFLQEKAKKWNNLGEAVTYVFVDAQEKLKENISRIYGFASINTIGLTYSADGSREFIPCAEIRLFAIAKQLRKRHDSTIKWSDIIFKTLLQELYHISTHIIGFKGIFLNANHEGYELYTNNGFASISKYIIPPEDSKFDLEKCTPLLLTITPDVIYDIFSTTDSS